MKKYLGLDMSLNHGAMVLINSETGWLEDYRYYTTTKKWTNNDNGLHLDVKEDDPDIYDAERLEQITCFLCAFIYVHGMSYDGLAAVEGYAFGRNNKSHQIGELGGLVKHHMYYITQTPYRIYPPKSVKMFVTGNGNASKEDMIKAQKPKIEGLPKGLPDENVGDLCDALGLAEMLRIEDRIKTGELTKAGLLTREAKTFYKGKKVNFVDRPWIARNKDKR